MRGPIGNVRAPDLTYTDRINITLGGKHVEVIHMPTIHADDNTVVRFVDGIGSLATPVNIGNITLAQGDGLRGTFDCQIVVINAAELRDAKRAKLRASPVIVHGRVM